MQSENPAMDAFSVKTPISWSSLASASRIVVMEETRKKNLPESVDVLVLDSSGQLKDDVGLEELPYHLSDPDALVWCDIASLGGGRVDPTGGSCGRYSGSTT